jgi:hypothetical protein
MAKSTLGELVNSLVAFDVGMLRDPREGHGASLGVERVEQAVDGVAGRHLRRRSCHSCNDLQGRAAVGEKADLQFLGRKRTGVGQAMLIASSRRKMCPR